MNIINPGIPDGSVTTVKLADGAVTTAKVANGSLDKPVQFDKFIDVTTDSTSIMNNTTATNNLYEAAYFCYVENGSGNPPSIDICPYTHWEDAAHNCDVSEVILTPPSGTGRIADAGRLLIPIAAGTSGGVEATPSNFGVGDTFDLLVQWYLVAEDAY